MKKTKQESKARKQMRRMIKNVMTYGTVTSSSSNIPFSSTIILANSGELTRIVEEFWPDTAT